MNKGCQFTLADYRTEVAEEIVHLWRQSKRHALGDYVEPRSFGEMLDFLVNVIVKTHHVRLAACKSRGIIVGFMALHGNELGMLSVHYRDSRREWNGESARLEALACVIGLTMDRHAGGVQGRNFRMAHRILTVNDK